jgi:hypothetical protein
MQARDALAALEAGQAAYGLGRFARSVELYERALAAADADATLPRDSLLVTLVLYHLVEARVETAELHVPGGAADAQHNKAAARAAAWHADPRALALSQRALKLMRARFDAGTLFAPLTPVERSAMDAAELSHDKELPGALPSQRADRLFAVAADAMMYWPPPSDLAAEEARLRGVTAAAKALLTLNAHGVMHEGRRMNDLLLLPQDSAVLVTALLREVLHGNTASGGLLHKLRATCGLTREEEATLRQDVLPAVTQMALAERDAFMAGWEAQQRRAAEDVARHGLRACALPGCCATEPQPKTFKVCSRCRRACYCSPAHQAADWRRHKREDACAAAAAK